MLFGVCSRSVRIERPLSLPRLNDGEVIGAHHMLQNIEAQVPFLLPAGFRQASKQTRRDGFPAGFVDVSNNIDSSIVSTGACAPKIRVLNRR